MPRRSRFDSRTVSSLPLVILAGLPNPIHEFARQHLESTCSPKPRVIALGAGVPDRVLYPNSYVVNLVSAVTDFASRLRDKELAVQVPSEILLLYVPADDEENLLTVFDFSVFPIRLGKLAEYDRHGRQLRHDKASTAEYLPAALELGRKDFGEVKRRLSSPSPKELLFLPPGNFHVSRTSRLSDVFRRRRQSVESWVAPVAQISCVRVNHIQAPNFARNGSERELLMDARDLIFPPDPNLHGATRELSKDEEPNDRAALLRSMYRLGVPLRSGFHHDVKHRERGLDGEEFNCSRNGQMTLRCSHANVYPNDFVRPAKK